MNKINLKSQFNKQLKILIKNQMKHKKKNKKQKKYKAM